MPQFSLTVGREDLRRYISVLLDLVFPPHCVVCGAMGSWLCVRCIQNIAVLEPPWCPHCGRSVSSAGLCRVCQNASSHLVGMRSVSAHVAPLREAVHALKYNGMRVLAEPLGEILADYWRLAVLPSSIVVPVPLHEARLRQRGYNQSFLLAQSFAARVSLPVDSRALVRRRNTRCQVELSSAERRVNVAGAFWCRSGALAGERVLLIDDVLTTGATLEACASALLDAGAKEVWALTLTRAVDGHPIAPDRDGA